MKLTAFSLLLALAGAQAVSADESSVRFTIDPTRNNHPISRYIYGVNRELAGEWAGLPLERVGGNRWTAYNWINNASNAGNDWHFQNDGYLSKSDSPAAAVVHAIENASNNKAAILLTIPMNGYVAADKKGDGDVHQSGPEYLKLRFRPEAPAKRSSFTLTPDPNSPTVYQDEFVNWIATRYPYGLTDPQRPIFFALDNEPDLWQSTHKEVHPDHVTYAELARKSIDYSTAIKRVAPGATIFGAVNYGWSGYGTLQHAPDAAGRDFQAFFLAEMKAAEKAAGHRLIDVLDFHWYPEAQGGGKRVVVADSSPAVAEARKQAPRSLWDPAYTEESWITRSSTHGPIALLPRIQKKIDANYPGTRMAISEYNFGGGGHISGGIAEADVLGILGNHQVFAAAVWPMAKDESFIAGALKAFRNFDGNGAAFGDTSVSAASSDPVQTSVYASVDSRDPRRMVLVAINKSDHPIKALIDMEDAGAYKSARVFQLTADGAVPRAAGPLTLASPAHWQYMMPPESVNTIELRIP